MIKPSVTSTNLQLGKLSAGLDEEIAAVGSQPAFQKVFVYNISTNPAHELTILISPDSTGDDRFGHISVAVNRGYGILVGAPLHDIGSMLRCGLICCLFASG